MVSNIFGIFTPKLGEDSYFDEHIFRKGLVRTKLWDEIDLLLTRSDSSGEGFGEMGSGTSWWNFAHRCDTSEQRKKTWLFSCLGYLGDYITLYVGIIISHYKDPY